MLLIGMLLIAHCSPPLSPVSPALLLSVVSDLLLSVVSALLLPFAVSSRSTARGRVGIIAP